jgi:hypothetical protein
VILHHRGEYRQVAELLTYAVRAQQTQIPVIGYLSSGTREGSAYRVQAFR